MAISILSKKHAENVPVNLNELLAYLLSFRVNDFYAHFISALPMREVVSRHFMMGVTFERGHHVLLYNPEWVNAQLELGRKGIDEVQATLAHEAMHVIMAHIARQVRLHKMMFTDNDKRLFQRYCNIGVDIAVNDVLVEERAKTGAPAYKTMHENPDDASQPPNWVLGKNYKFQPKLSYEDVMQLLMDPSRCKPDCQAGSGCKGKCRQPILVKIQLKGQGGGKGEKQGKGQGQGEGDGQGENKTQGQGGRAKPQQNPGDQEKQDGEGGQGEKDPNDTEPQNKHQGAHEMWFELPEGMSPEEAEILAAQIESDAYETIKKVAASIKDRGTIPGFVQEQLEKLNRPPEIPWRKVMRQVVMRYRKSLPVRSLERPRRRWMNLGSTIYPGTKRDQVYNVFFAIDTSGSMSTQDLEDGLVEMQGIVNIDREINVTIVEFDTQIHKEYKLRGKHEVDPKLTGRGGTDFNAAFDRALELSKKGEVDVIVIFTDGYAPSPDKLRYAQRDVPVIWCLTEGGQHPCPGFGLEIRRPERK